MLTPRPQKIGRSGDVSPGADVPAYAMMCADERLQRQRRASRRAGRAPERARQPSAHASSALERTAGGSPAVERHGSSVGDGRAGQAAPGGPGRRQRKKGCSLRTQSQAESDVRTDQKAGEHPPLRPSGDYACRTPTGIRVRGRPGPRPGTAARRDRVDRLRGRDRGRPRQIGHRHGGASPQGRLLAPVALTAMWRPAP